MSTVALTGGGTGGHIIPCLALVPELKKYYDRIIYIGSEKELDRRLVENEGLPFYEVETAPFSRGNLLKNIEVPFRLSQGISEAKDIFSSENPSCLFAKGGYASLPAAYAAKALKIPVVAHESDYSVGLANKIISSFSEKLITSFPETKGGDVCIGTPVRRQIFEADKKRAKKYAPKDLPVITVTGGSQGAAAINAAVWSSLNDLCKDYQIIHISGNGYDKNVTHSNYTQLKYADDIQDIFALSDAVICRAGANTLTELATLGKRTLAIPLPKGTSRGDQVENARSFEKRGYCRVLTQPELSSTSLNYAINSLMHLPAPEKLHSENYVELIVAEIVSASK